MPTYEIEQYEIHTQKYRIEADCEVDALIKLFNGEAEPVDGSLEYVEVCEDLGLPVEEHQVLAAQLYLLGESVGEHVIPSIRSIVKVE